MQDWVEASHIQRDIHPAELASLLGGFPGPVACHQVVHRLVGSGQVQRDRRELRRGATLEEQDLEIGGNCEQLTEIRLRLRYDLDKLFATVRHLHDRASGALHQCFFFSRNIG